MYSKTVAFIKNLYGQQDGGPGGYAYWLEINYLITCPHTSNYIQ